MAMVGEPGFAIGVAVSGTIVLIPWVLVWTIGAAEKMGPNNFVGFRLSAAMQRDERLWREVHHRLKKGLHRPAVTATCIGVLSAASSYWLVPFLATFSGLVAYALFVIVKTLVSGFTTLRQVEQEQQRSHD